MQVLALVFPTVTGYASYTTASIPDRLRLWVTEWGTWGNPSLENTWMQVCARVCLHVFAHVRAYLYASACLRACVLRACESLFSLYVGLIPLASQEHWVSLSTR